MRRGNVVGTQVWLLLLRGDHDMNEIKVSKLPGLDAGFRFATEPEIDEHFGCKPGYLGPLGLKKPVKIVADRDVAVMADWISGANEVDFHMTGINWGRDLPEPEMVADIRNVVAGDASPDGKGLLAIERGIEVGHVFVLGTKYSKAMNATFLDEAGKPQFLEMGCYGIGITRLPAAAIEQNNDERGIIWPDAIAPFTVVLCPIGMDRSADVKARRRGALRRAAGCWRRRAAGRPRRAPRRDVRRLGADRRAAPRGDLRPRHQGRPVRIPAPARHGGDQGGGGRGRRVRPRQAAPHERCRGASAWAAPLPAHCRWACRASRWPVRRSRSR